MTEQLPPDRPLRRRHDGWTTERQEAFCTELTRLGTVEAACRAVGMSTTNAYRAKARIAAFSARWEQALVKNVPKVDAEVIRRGIEGWEEPVFQGGKQVGVRRRYSDSLLRMQALRGDQALVRTQEGTEPPEDPSETRPRAARPEHRQVKHVPIEEVEAEILRRLAAMARQERKRAAAEADDLLRRGRCP